MRKPIVIWFSRFDRPEAGRLLIFDFGRGPTVGKYDDGQFFSLDNPDHWDRVLVNQWRYLESDAAPIVQAA